MTWITRCNRPEIWMCWRLYSVYLKKNNRLSINFKIWEFNFKDIANLLLDFGGNDRKLAVVAKKFNWIDLSLTSTSNGRIDKSYWNTCHDRVGRACRCQSESYCFQKRIHDTLIDNSRIDGSLLIHTRVKIEPGILWLISAWLQFKSISFNPWLDFLVFFLKFPRF